jgi:hypothetical protein
MPQFQCAPVCFDSRAPAGTTIRKRLEIVELRDSQIVMMYRRTLLIQSVHRPHQFVEEVRGEGAVGSAKHRERRASGIGGCDINAVC